jgi:hypothetical protein
LHTKAQKQRRPAKGQSSFHSDILPELLMAAKEISMFHDHHSTNQKEPQGKTKIPLKISCKKRLFRS